MMFSQLVKMSMAAKTRKKFFIALLARAEESWNTSQHATPKDMVF